MIVYKVCSHKTCAEMRYNEYTMYTRVTVVQHYIGSNKRYYVRPNC